MICAVFGPSEWPGLAKDSMKDSSRPGQFIIPIGWIEAGVFDGLSDCYLAMRVSCFICEVASRLDRQPARSSAVCSIVKLAIGITNG